MVKKSWFPFVKQKPLKPNTKSVSFVLAGLSKENWSRCPRIEAMTLCLVVDVFMLPSLSLSLSPFFSFFKNLLHYHTLLHFLLSSICLLSQSPSHIVSPSLLSLSLRLSIFAFPFTLSLHLCFPSHYVSPSLPSLTVSLSLLFLLSSFHSPSHAVCLLTPFLLLLAFSSCSPSPLARIFFSCHCSSHSHFLWISYITTGYNCNTISFKLMQTFSLYAIACRLFGVLQ